MSGREDPPREPPVPAADEPASDGPASDKTAASKESSAATYQVHPPSRASAPAHAAAPAALPVAPAEPKPEGPVAVFISHGMGQQIPFETLDLVSEGLRRQDAIRRGVPLSSLPAPGAASVALGEERLARAELRLATLSGGEREVHVYEAYWAPLTEGQVTLRDVVAFLLRGAWNGIWNAARKGGFRRWLFRTYPMLTVPASTLLLLAASVTVILSLIALNTAVVLVAAARSPLKEPPRWLGDALFTDLTTLMNIFVTLALLFGLALLAAKSSRKKSPAVRRAAGAASVATLAILLVGTSLAGLSLPILFWAHVRCSEADRQNGVLRHVLGAGFVEKFDLAFSAGALALLAVCAAAFVLLALGKLLAGGRSEMKAGGVRAVSYAIGLLCAIVVVVCLTGEIRAALGLCRSIAGLPVVRRAISWPLLFAISAWVRSLLVQYPGDVAAYVTPQALDRFQKLRTEIKEAVWKRARAVYAAPRTLMAASAAAPGAAVPGIPAQAPDFLYGRCVMVGHSLGSVIAYDVLNRMIQEDETAVSASARLEVVSRTPMFLTFGSPLDKTAFVFGVAGKDTTEAREALAASVQPMICDYRFRPARWVNLFSAWDVVSGSLDFYDPPGSTDPRRVENRRDPQASTLLAAHLEYWENPLLFEILHAELTA